MTVKWWWSVLVVLACWSIHRRASMCTAYRLGLRPVPSNEPGEIPDLIEMPNPALDPRPGDVNITALRIKLGSNFDPNYMSITTPEHMVPVTKIPFRRNRRGRLVPTGKMPADIRELDTKFFSLSDGKRLRTRISGQLRRKIQQYLWGRTTCPVQRQWKDLGLRFWPRWLLEGHCHRGETSCSVPSGMYCRVTANEKKMLLRWHCGRKTIGGIGGGQSVALQQYNSLPGTKTPGTANAVKVCQWILVQYQVVTECGCGCASNDL